MTEVQQTIAHELHQRASRLPSRMRLMVKAGEIVALLNALWAAERRGDVAEASLASELERAAEQRLHCLLAAATDKRPAEEHPVRPAPPRQLTFEHPSASTHLTPQLR